MQRILGAGLLAALLLATGCSEEDAATGPSSVLPDGVKITTIVRNVTPDHPFYVTAFPTDPVAPDDQGTWLEEAGGDDYRVASRFGLVGSAHFVSMDTGEAVPVLVQIGSTSAGASVRVVVDQVRGTLGIFGLKDHHVRLTLDVYRLN